VRRVFWTTVGVAVVSLIGWLDWITGPDIGFSLLYLIPVAIAGWRGGVTTAVIVGSFAGLSWLYADIAWKTTETGIAISVWNAFTRFVIYISQGVLLALLRRDREKLRHVAARESALARTDSGTSLPNARAFVEAVEKELDRARESREAVCLLYLDLDNFKEINDRFGHAAGDEVLQRVADALQHSIRGHDMAARLGGDEFAVLLRGVDENVARAVSERIRARVAGIGAAYPGSHLGATVGVTWMAGAPESAQALLRAGDRAMYEGKTAGKDQVVVRSVLAQ
jgi:diguanylate cyclase (GGDEF)-like protein